MTIRFVIVIVDSSVMICLLVPFGLNLSHKKEWKQWRWQREEKRQK